MFDTIWLGGMLRGRDREMEFAGNIQNLSPIDQTNTGSKCDLSSAPGESSQDLLSNEASLLSIPSFRLEFGVSDGVWDDDIFERMANMSYDIFE